MTLILIGIGFIVLGIAIAIGAIYAFKTSNFLTDICVSLVNFAPGLVFGGFLMSVIGLIEYLTTHSISIVIK